jgi:opacity protein-like surface antigen
MKRLGIVFLLAGLWLVPSVAAAQQTYFAAKVGFHMTPDTHLGAADVNPDPGLSLLAALGYQLNQPFRLEAELSYLHHTYDARNRFSGVSFEGDYDLINFMFNGIVDLNREGPVNPYAGVGVGVTIVNVDFNNLGVSTNDTDAEPALQTILGLEFIPQIPNARITAEYRYFLAADPEFRFSGVTASTELETHQILIGFRYLFP